MDLLQLQTQLSTALNRPVWLKGYGAGYDHDAFDLLAGGLRANQIKTTHVAGRKAHFDTAPDSNRIRVLLDRNEEDRAILPYEPKKVAPLAEGKTLPIFLGCSPFEAMTIDLCDVGYHVLIGGASRMGKSNMLHNILITWLKFSDAELMLCDPKCVELSAYAPLERVIGYADDVAPSLSLLSKACDLMDRRYKAMKAEGKRKYAGKPLVVVIDELADLMLTSKGEAEEHIIRLTQKGAAARVHLVCATQNPKSEVISSLAKVNQGLRIAFAVPNYRASESILDVRGAEELPPRGAALASIEGKVIRVTTPFIDDDLIDSTIASLPHRDVEIEESEVVEGIGNPSRIEIATQVVSGASPEQGITNNWLKTRMSEAGEVISVHDARDLMNQLEVRGVVTPYDKSKRARFLVGDNHA